MSVTTNTTDAALASAAAVLRLLPVTDLTAGAPVDGPMGLETAIPAPGSKAVSASLSGDVSGTIVIVLSPEVATLLENGPIPQELVAALEPALTDAAAALATSFGSVRHEAALALDAEAAVGSTGGHDSITVVPFSNTSGHVASLVLMLTPGAGGASELVESPFETLSATLAGGGSVRAVELLNDVEMGVTAELGRTRMTVRELLSMQPGSIVELDRAAGSPVDLLVNGTLVARGEVVVIDEEFGVRITEIIGYDAKKNG